MAISTVSKGQLFLNNSLLGWVKSFTVTETVNNKDVFTLANRGLPGQAVGQAVADISFDMSVPKAGYEVRFDQLMLENENHTLSFLSGGVIRSFEGRFQSIESSASTDAEMTVKVTFRGNIIED